MRTFIFGIAAAILLAVAAGFVFSTVREPVYEVRSSSSVRVGEPGSNLVGPKWTGNPRVGAAGRHAAAEGRAGSPD